MKKNFLLLLSALLGASTVIAQLPSYVPTTGLVAWYPFTGNANDMSGNGYNGATSNATLTTDRDGNPNEAYSFNGGNSYIDCGNISVLNNSPQLTVSAWFKSTGNLSQARIISKEHYQNNSDGWHIGYAGTGSSYLKVDMSTNLSGGGINNTVSIDTTWHHVALVFYGPGSTEMETLKMYIDGIEVPLSYYTPIPSTTSTAVYPLYIGNNYGLASINQWWGKIDDVGIWSTALTAQEIADLHTAQDLTVGIESGNSDALMLIPNPSRDAIRFNRNASQVKTVSIYNMLGELKHSQPFSQTVNVSDLPSGIYMVEVEGRFSSEIVRFQKL